jgi:pseudouridine-5'-phosphate glycosidase
MEKCENCGRTIGSLEAPQIYNCHVVCPNCKTFLSSEHPDAVAPNAALRPVAIADQPAVIAASHTAVTRATDAVVSRLIAIAVLITFIFGCVGVIMYEVTDWLK